MTQASKPPYGVPTMAEIRELPPNGLRVVSTFSGTGGSCLGFRMAGYRILWSNEFVPAARASYKANADPATILDARDIRQVTAEEILTATGLTAGELDVFEGSPPCAAFSTAGSREAKWGTVSDYSGTKQRTDDLFYEYARLLEGLQPRAFVAENVSGLIKGTAKGYFKLILARLRDCGYRVGARLLDGQWLGVPQARQRLIFVGVREDLDRDPVFPAPLPYRYSVRDALPELSGYLGTSKGRRGLDSPAPTVMSHNRLGTHSEISVLPGDPTGPSLQVPGLRSRQDGVVAVGGNGRFGQEVWQIPDLPAKTIGSSPNAGNGRVGPGDIVVGPEDIGRYAIGREWEKLRPGEQSERYFQLVRADPNRPSPTITSRGGGEGVAAVTHPTERRKFTIPELRRICGFPDDFELVGTFGQQWERLGRAVPPVMMRAVAEALRDRVLT
ncbi:DNA cytosine methyltransferase [Parafrankia discariae]|uniref:DNA cytosine methyltransferase n=1 Tax=Parafrankia discariae TaxID=365528 RepID=UPI0003A033B7|nr:DNA cytosine methyltransferase [Parafrankia discariae]